MIKVDPILVTGSAVDLYGILIGAVEVSQRLQWCEARGQCGLSHGGAGACGSNAKPTLGPALGSVAIESHVGAYGWLAQESLLGW